MDVRRSHRLFDTTFLPFTFLFVVVLLCTRYLMNDGDDPQRPVALLVFLRCSFHANALGIRVNSLPLANLLVTGCRALQSNPVRCQWMSSYECALTRADGSVCLTGTSGSYSAFTGRTGTPKGTTGKSCTLAVTRMRHPQMRVVCHAHRLA
ncbi:hypothetical protein EDB83DRAFT_1176659 [Lactarius deliciosus]|nr:hypothetical protein EDB83DRAFT_1176659 [Lactarius deliciosus]